MEVREPSAKYLAKAAYKQTEVGMIPEDWDITPLHQLADKIMVGIASAATHAYRDRGVVMFRNQNIKPGYLDDTDILYIAEEYETTFKNKRLIAGDLLTARTGYPGTTSIVPKRYEGSQSFTTLITRPRHGSVDSGFLCHFINSESGQRYFDQAQIGGGQKNVNAGALKNLPVCLPPTVVEQQAIAEALDDADALIESLEQLLAKKRQIMQGAMQELLTGQKRLAGFAEEWPVKPMEALGQTYGGLTGKSKVDFGHGSACYIPFMNVMSGTVIDPDWLERVDVASGENQNSAQEGDLFFNGSSETPDEVGFCSVLMHRISNLYLNSFCFGYRLFPESEVNALFLAYWFRSQRGRKAMLLLAQGATRYNIAKSAFLKLEVPQPSAKEQTAIAAVLSDMDAEIAALEAKLSKARRLKQGMMQELLTGRIRLVPPRAEVIPFPEKTGVDPKKLRPHNRQIEEAVMLGVLAKAFGSEKYPLARVRRTKLLYLLHRHTEGVAEGYLKKAAGPYNPKTRYQGGEGIALKNGYVRAHHNGTYEGFVAGDMAAEAEAYFGKWFEPAVRAWLDRFHYTKTDELELLATVDMAMEDLRSAGSPVSLDSVKRIIQAHPEWQAKLDRPIFSDANIERAIAECHNLFRH